MKTISVELPERTAEEIDGYVRKGWFTSAAEAIRTAVFDFVRRTRTDLHEPAGPPPAADTRPIEEVLAEIGRQVPEEEWAKLPADFNENLDHYLYGSPKK